MSHNKYSNLVYKGKTLKEWAKINGIKYSTLRMRIKKGYSVEVAVSQKKLNYKPN